MTNSRILQLMLTKGIGDAAIKRVFDFLDEESYLLDDIFESPELFRKAGLKQDIIERLLSTQLKEQAQSMADELDRNNIRLITERETQYPQYLKCRLGKKCPPILFAKGNISRLNHAAVGFCGSRKASQKGISIAADCAKQLANNNIVVVSGYAAGTDLAAHRSALMNMGSTVFVLAEGILRATIKRDICKLINSENHVFVSQFLPNTTWNAGNAMKRNGVIIGLSQAMILVESGKTGGTFAAGEEALRTGCPLFVIDFSKPEVSAEANPYFIQSGGYPIRGKNGIPNLNKVFAVINDNSEKANTTPVESSAPKGGYEQIKFDL